MRRNGFENAYTKWIATRGSNGAPLIDPEGCTPNLIIITRPYIQRALGEKGLRMKTATIRRPPGQVLDAQVKSLNYLNPLLAKIEAKAAGVDHALLPDIEGRICEAPGCNVFLVRGTRLSTPRRDILQGITRGTVIELAGAAGLDAREEDLELYHAYTADEMFLTSTAGSLMPVAELDGRTIGEGRPGPVFAALHEAYRQLLASGRHGTPVAVECHPSSQSQARQTTLANAEVLDTGAALGNVAQQRPQAGADLPRCLASSVRVICFAGALGILGSAMRARRPCWLDRFCDPAAGEQGIGAKQESR